MISYIRKNRVLKVFSRFIVVDVLSFIYSRERIGKYGPFLLQLRYRFRNLAKFGDRHNAGFDICMNAIGSQSTFFDIGAHVGFYTLPAAKICKEVHAFEACKPNHKLLLRHIKKNNFNNVYASNVAITDGSASSIKIFCDKRLGSPFSSIVVPPKKTDTDFQAESVNCLSLDIYCETKNVWPDVIKIDIEGGEYNMLDGAKKALHTASVTFLSVHSSHLAKLGISLSDLQTKIQSLSLDVYDLDNNKTSVTTCKEVILRRIPA